MTAESVAAAIRLLRARHNAALASRDLAGAIALSPADAVLVTGNGGLLRGQRAIREAWRGTFGRGDYIRYVRQPDEILSSADLAIGRVAESGHWEGLFGSGRSAGRYLAHWEERPEGWRIVAEVYVTLEEGALPA